MSNLNFLNRHEIITLNSNIEAGISMLEFRRIYKYLPIQQRAKVLDYVRRRLQNDWNKILGHKTEPYASEEQMIIGIPKYTMNDLSKSELKFYQLYSLRYDNNRNRKYSPILQARKFGQILQSKNSRIFIGNILSGSRMGKTWKYTANSNKSRK